MASAQSGSGKPLETVDGISYYVLTPDHRDAVLVVLARAFCTEPVVSALGERCPEMKASFLDWIEFVEYWMDHCSSNGMSVVAIDEKKHRVAGAFIVRDLLMVPEGFKEKYSSDGKALTPWMQMLWWLDGKATERLPALGETGKAVDLWFLGVHPDYRGRKVSRHLTKHTLPLTKKAGYKYATIEATSAFTSGSAAFNKFTPVFEVEAKHWEWKGKPIYTTCKPPHGKWTFWVKDLDTVEV